MFVTRSIECCRAVVPAERGAGIGALSVLDVFGGSGRGAACGGSDERRRARRRPNILPRAKRVIMLHMLGAISHVDTFDYKPMLEKMTGQEMPPSVRDDAAAVDDVRRPVGVPDRRPAARRSRQQVRAGRGSATSCRITGEIADDLCFIKTHAYRARQPRSRVEVPAHGLPARGAAVCRRLGELRARVGQSRSAELRRHELRQSRQGVPQDAAIWGPGFLAVASPGRRVSRG